MKKIILAALLVSGLTSAFATTGNDNGKNINKTATSSFNSNFNHARNVSWTESSRFTIATFTMNNKIMYAYYDLQGKYIGTIHNIATTELPESLSASLKKQYAKYWVSELFELNSDQDSSYFVRVEDSNGSRVLRSTDGQTWEAYNVSLPQAKM